MAGDTNQKIESQRAAFYEAFYRPLEQAAADMESPIEQLFYWALLNSAVLEDVRAPGADWLPVEFATRHAAPRAGTWWTDICTGDPSIVALPQAEVIAQGRHYRIDFLLRLLTQHDGSTLAETLVAIECDGHEFHERTKGTGQT